MATLNRTMKMTNPSNDFWLNVKEIAQTIVPWLSAGWVFHQAINKIFKYFSDSRDAELRELIKKEVKPELDELKQQLENIQKTLWKLDQK